MDFSPRGDRRRRADIVFTRRKIAVFMDGCFWHSCPTHRTAPKSNVEYWESKLRRNVERDRETTQSLTESGWTVLRFWEHEDPLAVATAITAEVRAAVERSEANRRMLASTAAEPAGEPDDATLRRD